jgi:two-component system cell cycle sensor histidine kinase/response regulator CckA
LSKVSTVAQGFIATAQNFSGENMTFKTPALFSKIHLLEDFKRSNGLWDRVFFLKTWNAIVFSIDSFFSLSVQPASLKNASSHFNRNPKWGLAALQLSFQLILVGCGFKFLPLAIASLLSVLGGVGGFFTVWRAVKRIQRDYPEKIADPLLNILENCGDAVIKISANGTILECNVWAEKILGYSAGELLSMSVQGIVDSGSSKDVEFFIEKAKRGKAVYNFEGVWLRKSVGRVFVTFTVAPVRDSKGRILSLMIVARDFTARKEIEQALLESEDRYRHLVEESTEAIFVVSEHGHILFSNATLARLLGKTDTDDLVGQFVGSILRCQAFGEMMDLVNEGIGRKLKGRVLEGSLLGKGRSPLEVEIMFIHIAFQGCPAIMIVAREMTDHKKVEKRMLFLAAMVESSSDAIVGFDNQMIITSWNKGAENIFGYTASEMLGKTFNNYLEAVVPERLRESSLGRTQRLRMGGNVYQEEVPRLRKDGSEIIVSMTLTSIRDSEGRIIGHGGIVQDITKRKKAEETYRRQEAQLRLSQKMEAIGQLAGGVAHDFNNLLCVVSGNSDVLLRNLPQDDPRRVEVVDIQEAVQRGSELTSQLLAFGKRQISKTEPLNLKEVVSRLNRMLARLMYDNIELKIRQDKSLKYIMGDPIQIEQIILNLTINARDAMLQGGSLLIETHNVEVLQGEDGMPPGSYVRVTVKDSGMGMSEEVQKHIFEPFFSTKGDKGTGLGLATVYGIVQQMKGHIRVKSVLGQGSEFLVYFPITEAPVMVDVPAKAILPQSSGTETVLIAEDDESVRKILVKLLQYKGYRTLEASNGLDALEKAESCPHPIDLLLTDVMMPKMNGNELAESLAKKRPSMKVIFISGYPNEILAHQGVEAQDITLIQKPFTSDHLTQKIRETLDRKAS